MEHTPKPDWAAEGSLVHSLRTRIKELEAELQITLITFSADLQQRLEAEKAELVEAHKAISLLHGNMPLDSIDRVSGINDGRDRAIKLRAAVEISRAALTKAEPEVYISMESVLEKQFERIDRLEAEKAELVGALEDCIDELWQLHEQIHPDCIANRPKRCPSRASIETGRAAIAKANEKQ